MRNVMPARQVIASMSAMYFVIYRLNYTDNKYEIEDHELNQYQILNTNLMRIV